MNLSPQRPGSGGLGARVGVGLVTAILVLFTSSSAKAQLWNNFGFGGYGVYSPGFGMGYSGWGSPGFGVYNGLGYGAYNGLGYGAYSGLGYGYNGLGYGAYNGLGYGGYNGLGYGLYGSGLNINLGGRNLLHIGRGVNPLWRGNGLGYGRGYYGRNWYGRDFDDWYDRD
ncbi:MAG TPA: hypothetical protein VFT74_10620 [Isosphaeraceae bacterium]|nr:hypothetical protein [Isosphaeraceae bacterium]